MGVNRKFDFRQVWKFCWDLSNIISGGNWLFRWDCVFQVGLCTPLRTMLYRNNNLNKNWFKFTCLVDIRVQIKHIVITKCNLFFCYRDAKEISFYYFCNKNVVQIMKKYTWIPFILLGSCLCLVECVHLEFRVSTQIMVCNYCIVKCKKFSTCGRLLMPFRPFFCDSNYLC